MELFATYLGAHFDKVIMLVPNSFDEEPERFDPSLVCPYPRIAYLSSRQGNAKRKGIIQRAKASVIKRYVRFSGIAGTKRRIARNLGQIDRKFAFSQNDILFFPNAEPFAVEAFCTYFSHKQKDQRPRLHFRMIGVHDKEACEDEDPFEVVARHITRAQDNGIDVQVSAETPKYLHCLQQDLPDAFLLPYPFNAWQAPTTKALNTIGCLGQGRDDKGYFRIADIVSKVAETHPEAEWIVHSMRETNPKFSADYQARLAQNANLRIEPGFLSNEALNALYDEVSFSMLPYNEETYRIRGSAVLQEALARGQLCIAPAGTGIASALDYFGNGLVARTNEEFATAVGTLLDMPERERQRRVKQAQARYDEVLASSIPKILHDREEGTADGHGSH